MNAAGFGRGAAGGGERRFRTRQIRPMRHGKRFMLIELVWGADWGFGVPMILASIAFHVSGLVCLEWLLITIERRRQRPRTVAYFLVLMLIIANIVMLMHVLEALAWALLYLYLGALPNFQMSVLYSLNALTSYGHEAVALTEDWRLLGAIESMNGVIIFGLTTAFLFGAMRELQTVRHG